MSTILIIGWMAVVSVVLIIVAWIGGVLFGFRKGYDEAQQNPDLSDHYCIWCGKDNWIEKKPDNYERERL